MGIACKSSKSGKATGSSSATARRLWCLRISATINSSISGPGKFTSILTRKRVNWEPTPRALGVLRQTYSHSLRAALRAEIDKDFVKLPVHEIEKHLAA